MTNKLEQLQQANRARLQIRDLYEQASPEARRVVMDLLRTDIDLTESLMEIGTGAESGGDSKIPGDLHVASIQREMVKSVEFAVYGAERNLRILCAIRT